MPKNVFDLEEISGKANSNIILIVIIAIFILIAGFSSFFIVDQQEEAVILRLGKFHKISEPGLHFKLPFGIDQNYNVPTQRNLKEEFGFRTRSPGVTTVYSSRDYPEESIMLTGDLNIVDVEWIIQYRITNPRNWLFNVNNQRKTIRDISQSVINLLVGDRTIFDIIGNERANIEFQSKKMMNDFFKKFSLGARITTVKLQNIVPPKGTVQDAFEDVNKAIQDRNRLINEGKELYNKAIPKARGVADKTIQEAQGYAIEKVNKAKGDVARYLAVQDEYKKNPKLVRMRLYYETMETIFKNIANIDIIDKNMTNFVPFKSLSAANAARGRGVK